MRFQLRVTGHFGAIRELGQLRDAAGRFSQYTASVGSRKPYAYGIETGRHRGGTLARRAGGAYYLRGAWEQAETEVVDRVVAALPNGGPAMDEALNSLERFLVERAREIVPVRSGELRDSITAGRGAEE